MSNFREAVKQLWSVVCPHCKNDDSTLIEPIGARWLCVVCGKTWSVAPKP